MMGANAPDGPHRGAGGGSAGCRRVGKQAGKLGRPSEKQGPPNDRRDFMAQSAFWTEDRLRGGE